MQLSRDISDTWLLAEVNASAGDESPHERTPRRIHFVYLTEAPSEFPLIYYIAVKSAIQQNADYEITLHCNEPPVGRYWSLLEGTVTLRLVPMPDKIFGRPVTRVEHRADILRLEILLEFGGIYLDLDTICLKPFGRFLHEKAVMGYENDVGLCNAVIVAPRNSEFLLTWYAGYVRFHNDQWNEFSVKLPLAIAKARPDLVDLAAKDVFFEPDYGPESLRRLFDEVGHFPNAHIFHLWNHVSKAHIAKISARDIFSRDSTYNLAARNVISAQRGLLLGDNPLEPLAAETAVLKTTFTNIYENSAWGKGSGNGSAPTATVEYRSFLENFISMNRVRSVIDIGCGDWQSSRYISFGDASYLGFDLVENLVTGNTAQFGGPHVEFRIMPNDPLQLPQAELLIMKDVLQHFSDEMILFYRDQIFPKYKYCLITNSFKAINYAHNVDIKSGMFRSLDLLVPPYNFRGSYVTESWNQWERIRTLLIANLV